AFALLFAAWIIPGAEITHFGGALAVAALVAILNALLPPIIAALRVPFTVGVGFFAILILDAGILLLAADIADKQIDVDSFWAALGVALIAAAVSTVCGAVAGIDDEGAYTVQV